MKTALKLVTFLIASSSFASAASMAGAALVDTNFTTSTGVALGTAYTAKIGFLSAGTVLTTTDNFASITPNWTNAGNIVFATGDAAGYNGYFTGQVIFTDAAGLAGKNVFVWVTDGANNNLVMGTTSVQFKADNAIPNSAAFSIENSTRNLWTTSLGTYSSAGANAANGGSFVLNNAIPEPSAALLGALGVLGLLRRRRN